MTAGFEITGLEIIALRHLWQCGSTCVVLVGIAGAVGLTETLMRNDSATG